MITIQKKKCQKYNVLVLLIILLIILIYIFQTKKFKLVLISPKTYICYYSLNEKTKSKKINFEFHKYANVRNNFIIQFYVVY